MVRPDLWMPDRGTENKERWGLGVGVPLLLAIVGVHDIIMQYAIVRRRWSTAVFHGFSATLVGIAEISLALLLHFRFYWVGHPRLWPYAEWGQLASLLSLVVSLIWLLVREFRF